MVRHPPAINQCVSGVVCGPWMLVQWFLPVIMLLLDRSQPARRAHGDDEAAKSRAGDSQSRKRVSKDECSEDN